MPNVPTYKSLDDVNEIRTYLEAHGTFLNQPDPVQYAAERLSEFSEEDLLEFVKDFRVVSDADGFQAGCFVYEDGWLQDIFFTENAHLQKLLTGLQRENIPHGVHFGPYRPSVRKHLKTVLETLSYTSTTDYEMSSSLLNAADVHSLQKVVAWTDGLDKMFKNLYQSLTPHPWPWDSLKHQAGGGKFTPELWLTDENFQALVAVNQPARPRTDEKVFNIVVSAGEADSLRPLLLYALEKMSEQAPLGTVNAHANPTTLPLYEALGFAVVSETPVFTFL
ncbi:hypothetical protein BH24DEI2_BH24DEI2_13140 [soil metagenome]